MKYIHHLLLAFICCCLLPVQGKNLIMSRQTSYLTYIYRLSDEETKKIFKKGEKLSIDQSFFHTLVDSYPTDSSYNKSLPVGHYLETNMKANTQLAKYLYVPDFEVMALNNHTDLRIQILDLKGNIISDANVKAGAKRLKWDDKTQCYIQKKSNKKGILSVEHKGNTAYFKLDRQYDKPAVLRSANTVLFRTPLKYISVPIHFITRLPADGVRSIKEGYANGSIYLIKKFFVNLYENIFEDDYYYDRYKKTKYYFVFNKPMYLPNDTVKFKAFITNRKGKPVKRPLQVLLEDDYSWSDRKLTNLTPYRKGAYEYQFAIHDSLKMKLDRSYDIFLTNKRYLVFAKNSFRYEDYELSKIKLNVGIQKKEHYANTPFSVQLKATDENELTLPDARVEILVLPEKMNDLLTNHIFLPDTLLVLEKRLAPQGETTVQIPDSLFPKSNFEYELLFRLRTSDNQTFDTQENVSYFYTRKDFDIELINDSIQFVYEENNLRKNVPATIYAFDNFGNRTTISQTTTPCTILLNPFYKTYAIEGEDITRSIDISAKAPLLQCSSRRTKDSIFIQIVNPRNLHYTYNVYKKNREKERAATDLQTIFKTEAKNRQAYLLSVNYIWGGVPKQENFSILCYDKKLMIETKQPSIVYPGQKTTLEVLVTDRTGKPVKNVDLTAYSYTKKFSTETAPKVPIFFGKKRVGKKIINDFNVNNKSNTTYHPLFCYDHWQQLAQLDSIEYYKFLYPKNSIYRYSSVTADSITQFAPFVLSEEGDNLRVHVIYVDNKPVYFGWTNAVQPYSFRIMPGYHTIEMRTMLKTIRLDSVYFEANKKHIISLNENIRGKHIVTTEEKPELSESEKRTLHLYILPYQRISNSAYALSYLKNGDNMQLLRWPDGGRDSKMIWAGPVSGNLEYGEYEGYKLHFNKNYYSSVPYYYNFEPRLIKMTEMHSNAYPSISKSLINNKINFSDEVMDFKTIKKTWTEYAEKLRKERYSYHLTSESYNGNLHLRLNNQTDKTPLDFLLFYHGNIDRLHIEPASKNSFRNLKEGYYQLIALFPDDEYYVQDSIFVKSNGQTYQKINISLAEIQKDSFAIKVNAILNERIINSDIYPLLKIKKAYIQRMIETGSYNTISGNVYNMKKRAIAGAEITIDVDGIRYGTATAADGWFSLKTPQWIKSFKVSHPGCLTVNVNVQQESSNIYLKDTSFVYTPMTQASYIQNNVVTGVVKDAYTGELLTGVIVLVNGEPTLGTYTMDGEFELRVPSQNSLIEFSYIGYGTQLLSAAPHITVLLKEETLVIGEEAEVVAIDMGTARREALTGSVTSVSVRSLNSFVPSFHAGEIINTEQALQGKIAGLSVVQGSGDPTTGNLRLRGGASLSGENTPLIVVDGVVYTGSMDDIDPSLIQNIDVLKDANATSIYGSRGANGVIVITTNKSGYKNMIAANAAKEKGADFDNAFLENASQANAIRRNFSDFAYWQPRLKTDENGKASFEVTFPDDVTSWNTYVLAMNDKKQSGQAQGNIRSFKPFMAQLAAPAFLVQGDSANIIGKTVNYTTDSVAVTTTVTINDHTIIEKTRPCPDAIIDTFCVPATQDTAMTVRYTMQKADGYFDGEERNITIYPAGMEETHGIFCVLDKDTTFHKTFDASLGTVYVYAKADYVDVLGTEVNRLINYRYLCNEQLASKLIALLAEKKIAEYRHTKWESNGRVEKIIKLLQKGRNTENLWGWWEKSPSNFHFSRHIINALLQAKQAGFEVNFLNGYGYLYTLKDNLDNSNYSNASKIEIMKILNINNFKFDHVSHINTIEKDTALSLNSYLKLMEIKQLNGMLVNLDTLKVYQQTTLFGSIYYQNKKAANDAYYHLENNDIQHTLIAYRMLRRENKPENELLLQKIRFYFLEVKSANGWHNTYEAAQIIETILPDLLKGNDKKELSVLTFSGDINKTVQEFPLDTTFVANRGLTISKTGDFPVYLTLYQRKWNASPKMKEGDLIVKTYFDNTTANTLKASEAIKLKVNLSVKKDADYVMINVPIPAGCSYANKPQNFRNEIHREYFKNETAIFCQQLRAGDYVFEIELIPRYTGQYTLNPAKAELMYFPTFNTNTEITKVIIK